MQCSQRKKRPTRDSDFSAIVVPSMRGSGYLDYTVENHASRSLLVMDEFRRHDLLCDLVLHVTFKDRAMNFKVHKVVLASCSAYFRAMFTRGFKECNASEVTLRDVCPEVVGRLIDFAYTARITVGEKCVLHLLLAAMRFQMEDVARACCDFLTKHLEPANVIGIARFAEEIGCTELHKTCRTYINSHFSEVTKVDEFFSLSHCQLLELISQESIKVLCESEVYQACTDWVRSDMESRAQYLHALLNAVHIYALPPKFLKNQLLSCPILSKANSCKDFLSKIFQEMTLMKLPPAPIRGTQLIYVAGGFRQHSLSTMQAFDPRRKVWIKLASMGTPCSGLGACMLFGLIYIVGGRNLSLQSNIDSSSLCCYNPMTNQWSQRASLNIPRNRVGVGVVDGCIYAVGGSQNSVHHKTVEKWDPESNRWYPVCPMSVARLGAGVAVSEGCLYVVGGYDGQNRWNTAEKYQHETNTWHQIAPMNTIRSGLGLVSVHAYLYAIGGYDGRSQLCTVERYNTVKNIWEPRASMQCCRSAHGVTVHMGRIFVFGGYNQHGFLSSVESYCPESNEWTNVSDMPVGLSGMGVAVTMEPCPSCLPEQEEEEEDEDMSK
uniref:Kelch-like ECH-associated protein 1a n=1 Tax=Iconisemion striatum TaxID=60296 RepID=A0A1A7XN07_9TELE